MCLLSARIWCVEWSVCPHVWLYVALQCASMWYMWSMLECSIAVHVCGRENSLHACCHYSHSTSSPQVLHSQLPPQPLCFASFWSAHGPPEKMPPAHPFQCCPHLLPPSLSFLSSSGLCFLFPCHHHYATHVYFYLGSLPPSGVWIHSTRQAASA